jgi:hypothetical protein
MRIVNLLGIGKRRSRLNDSTLVAYAARADNTLNSLVARPIAQVLNKQIKAWRTKFLAPVDGIAEAEIFRIPARSDA